MRVLGILSQKFDQIFLNAHKSSSSHYGSPESLWKLLLFRLFNPIEIVRDTSASINDLKEIELAAGRVAMVAFAGFAAQAAKTGEGPYSNLVDYMDDPLLLLGGRT